MQETNSQQGRTNSELTRCRKTNSGQGNKSGTNKVQEQTTRYKNTNKFLSVI
ncbi:hypothetical protein HYE16_04165 [Mycoplasmopsis bovis]|nr:hypothetical protein HYE16_04165 [Mycoplasmopsis bovis]